MRLREVFLPPGGMGGGYGGLVGEFGFCCCFFFSYFDILDCFGFCFCFLLFGFGLWILKDYINGVLICSLNNSVVE